MSRGTFDDDFTSKYGFGDGEGVEDRDFRARKYLVKALKARPDMKGIRVMEYNRPGLHNPCLIILMKDEKGKTDKQLLASSAIEIPLPDSVNEDIADMVWTAYNKTEPRRGKR